MLEIRPRNAFVTTDKATLNLPYYQNIGSIEVVEAILQLKIDFSLTSLQQSC